MGVLDEDEFVVENDHGPGIVLRHRMPSRSGLIRQYLRNSVHNFRYRQPLYRSPLYHEGHRQYLLDRYAPVTYLRYAEVPPRGFRYIHSYGRPIYQGGSFACSEEAILLAKQNILACPEK